MLIILSIQRDVRPTFFFPPGGTGRFTLDRTGLLGVSHLGKSEVTPKIAWFICGHVLIEGNIPCLKELFIKWRTVFRSKGDGAWISVWSIQEARAGDFVLPVDCVFIPEIYKWIMFDEGTWLHISLMIVVKKTGTLEVFSLWIHNWKSTSTW